MSKAEVKLADKPTLDKINDNSNRTKHSTWLLDYKTYKEDSYVFLNKEFLYELYRDYELSMNDPAINSDAFYYANQINEAGLATQAVYELSYTGGKDLSSIKKYTDEPFTDELIIDAIINNTIFIDLLYRLGSKVNGLISKDKFREAVAKSKFTLSRFYTLSRSEISQKSNYTYFLNDNRFTMLESNPLYKNLGSICSLSGSSSDYLVLDKRCFLIGISQTHYNFSGAKLTVREMANSSIGESTTINTASCYNNMVSVHKFFSRIYVDFDTNVGYTEKSGEIHIYYLEF